ncbi:MAG: phosphotransferase [Verrucomicrobiales bacterium]|nr:phosphotransferase [Verrucomicrobiales bacterium]
MVHFLPATDVESLTRQKFPEFGNDPIDLETIDRAGSGRCFYRLCEKDHADDGSERRIMAMNYTLDRPENGRFVAITKFLQSLEIRVPGIRGEDEDQQLLWVEDLGSQHLSDFSGHDWDYRRLLYQHALMAVAALHQVAEENAPNELPDMEGGFDEGLYRWEQGYFFDNFVANFCPGLDGETADEIRNGTELRELCEALTREPRALIHRDFQSSNVMVQRGRTWLIDYQGMRWGLPEYDIASLIYDPYVSISKAHRDDLATYYFDLRKTGESRELFEKRLHRCGAQRLMQALGAYGNLGLNMGKSEFLQHIPVAVERLREAAVERGVAPGLQVVLDSVEPNA